MPRRKRPDYVKKAEAIKEANRTPDTSLNISVYPHEDHESKIAKVYEVEATDLGFALKVTPTVGMNIKRSIYMPFRITHEGETADYQVKRISNASVGIQFPAPAVQVLLKKVKTIK